MFVMYHVCVKGTLKLTQTAYAINVYELIMEGTGFRVSDLQTRCTRERAFKQRGSGPATEGQII